MSKTPDSFAQALRLPLEDLGVAAFVLDAEGRIEDLTRAAASWLGQAPEALSQPFFSKVMGLGFEGLAAEDLKEPRRIRLAAPVPQPAARTEPPVVEALMIPRSESLGSGHLIILLPPPPIPPLASRLEGPDHSAAPLVFFRLDDHHIIREASQTAADLVGYSREALLGRSLESLLCAPDEAVPRSPLAPLLRPVAAGGVHEIHCRVLPQNGEPIPVALNLAVLGLQSDSVVVAVLRDLRGARRQEARLRLLSSAVEQAPAGILITDLLGRVAYVNEGFTQLTQFPREQVLGRSLLAPGSVLSAFARNPSLCQQILEGHHWQGEIRGVRRQGEDYVALATFSPIHDEEGEIRQLLCRLEDITGSLRDKEALAISEARFSAVASLVGEWLWEQDPSGFFTYCSEAVSDILGYRAEEVVGHHYQEFMTDADRARWARVLPPPNRVTVPFHRIINHYRHRDGHEVYTESSGTPIRDKDGKIIRWRGVDRDITERKFQEDQIKLRERAIEAASVGIAIAARAEEDYPIIYGNPALSLITGYPLEELLGRNLRLLQGQGTDEKDRDMIRKALKAGAGCELIIRNYRKDGQSFWNELQLSPVTGEQGQVTHYIGILTDVTERLRAENARHQLSVARQIQLSLLPKAPLVLEDVSAAGLCIAASQVGGDYYDIIPHGEFIDLVVADVSGHSVGAALIMSEMRSTLKAELRRADPEKQSVGDLLSVLNELLFNDLDGAELFITLFYLRYHRGTRQLRYACAGHNPPILLRQGCIHPEALDAEGMILGVRPSVHFEERSLQLEAGDRILLYTDGAVEAQNLEGEFFGQIALEKAFVELRTHHPESTLENLLDRLRAYVGHAYFVDDVTLAVFIVGA